MYFHHSQVSFTNHNSVHFIDFDANVFVYSVIISIVIAICCQFIIYIDKLLSID